MSDSVPSRTEAVLQDPQVASTDPATGSIVMAPQADLAGAGAIERMAERLRFYESFDELIQQNISRSGQLMREAGEKRDEAIATIAQSRQQIETERETQRAALTELLDDVMTIQQATERLAHRVSDALEQIEFDLEPIGLHDIGVLAGRQTGRLSAGLSSQPDPFQGVAEAVDDEYRLGVLGQPPLSAASMSSASVPHEVKSTGADRAVVRSGFDSSVSQDDVVESSNARRANPENAELHVNQEMTLDAPELDDHGTDSTPEHEPAAGAGMEAVPSEARTDTWDSLADALDANTSNPTADREDLTSVVEPYAEARVEPYAEETEPVGEVAIPSMQITSDVSDEGVDPGPTVDDVSLASDASVTDREIGAGSTLSFDTEPVSANATSPDVLAPHETSNSVDDSGEENTGAVPGSGIDVETLGVAAGNTMPSQGTPTESGADAVNLTGGHDASDVVLGDQTLTTRSTPDAVVVPHDVPAPVLHAVQPTEQQTTVVLDGVPRAAIALAIQRHILSKPDVLRAEVREYYDHRLTLFVTGRRATTATDLQDWDGSATWEQIRESPELLELRMLM